jgi:two-component system NarL family response regulator
MADPIRVLVADDHAIFRRGLRTVLAYEDDIELVGEAGDGEEAVKLAEETVPDVILMDIRMPKLTGIEATKIVRDTVPGARIVMFTVSDDDSDLYDAIRAGAVGYLLKEVAIDEIAESVRAVFQGQSLISGSMAAKLVTEFNNLLLRSEKQPKTPGPRLTERELQILKCVAEGKSNKDIGDQLFISENTVKNHVRNILEKLHLHSRMEAVMYAVRENLLELT